MVGPFVIQIHSGYGPLHYDLMLSAGQSLATWQLLVSPAELAPGRPVAAKRLKDHRPAYLSYEGPVSGGRGQVRMLDRGTYELIEADEGRWLFRLTGEAVSGVFELTRQAEAGEDWLLTLRGTDEPAG